MDELLDERVKQLKVIDDRLFLILSRAPTVTLMRAAIGQLQQDIRVMIAEAERQHAEF